MKPSAADTADSTSAGSSNIKADRPFSLPAPLLRLYDWLTSPAVIFYTLPPLMLLLCAGTIAQRYVGLYDAQKAYFSSFIFWLGPVPLPGGFALLGLISFGLLLKFMFKSTWSWRKSGINLAHLGVLVLLIGGLVTALNAREGFIVIPEGKSSLYISDYHQRELMIVRNDLVVGKIPHQKIKAGQEISREELPFSITVLESCRHCKIIKREESSQKLKAQPAGMASFMALEPSENQLEDEANLYGATLEINGATQIIFEAMPKPITIKNGDDTYEIIYGKQQRTLPFVLTLEKFQQDFHPGTAMAQAFTSDIIVEDNGSHWPVRIEMNKPLRYKGYTFFQSSFAENTEGKATVLSVVKNKGWLFPYIGTAIIAIGLLLHLLIMTGMRIGRKAS